MPRKSTTKKPAPVHARSRKKVGRSGDTGVPLELEILTEMTGFELGLVGVDTLFETSPAESALLLPGCGDLQVAAITRFGYRGKFPRPEEWENLLGMLEPGQELLWLISKRAQNGFSFHLALKSDGRPQTHSGRTFELRSIFRSILGQFAKRSFPESLATECEEAQVVDLLEDIAQNANGEVIVTSGLPSRSALEDSREFPEANAEENPDASLNDIVEPFADEAAFTVVFTVGRSDPDDANRQLTVMTDLRTVLSPYLKVQESRNESHSNASSGGTQKSNSVSVGQTESRNFVSSFFQRIFGSRADETLNAYKEHRQNPKASRVGNFLSWTGKGLYRGIWQKGLKKAPVARQRSESETLTYSETETLQSGKSVSITTSNAMLELVDQKLQESIRSLKKATGTGAFYLGAEVFSPKTELSLRIARSISGTMAGTRTHLRPFQTAVYRGRGFTDHLCKACTLEETYPSITLQSRHVAALFLPVPEADLPGLKTKRNVFYGKPNPAEDSVGKESSEETVWLGKLSHLSSGFTSRSLSAPSVSGKSSEFRIPAVDLTSHVLIAGTTGSGKTQRAAALLNQLPQQRFQVIVIESAKKTYRSLLRRTGVSTRILGLGTNGSTSLRINPFYFEPGTGLKRHISVFSDALADLLPVEALIGPKLREAIQGCYLRYEWDIETGKFRGQGDPSYPTMVDLHVEVLAVSKALKYGSELNSNYQGALLGRTRLFIDELYQDIFGWGGSQSLTEIFGEDDIILEMDALPPSEAKIPSFVLSLLLERMRSWQQSRREGNGGDKRDLIIVIEEAHNLLEKNLERQQSDREMGSGGFLLKQIVRLLQEGREAGMGVVVVDQSPASLADAVIRNTNTKIILRITDSEEAERIGATLGLTKEEGRDLQDLEVGEAVVKVKSSGKALKLSPAREVDRREATFAPGQVGMPDPDYYRASIAIRATVDSIAGKREAGVQGLRKLIDDLLMSAAENSEAKRFFAQKLVATVCEDRSLPSSPVFGQAPECGELALRVLALSGRTSVASLKEQLYHLVAGTSWPMARESFGADSISLLPLVGGILETNPHWAAMDGSKSLIDLIKTLVEMGPEDPDGEDQYSALLFLVNASRFRHEALRKVLLLLIP